MSQVASLAGSAYPFWMTAKFNSYDWLWLSLTMFPLLSIALLLPLSPQDYWWYLRLGQDILQTGAIPSVDTYSYTRAGAPFFYQAWLAAIVFWKTYQAGGVTLTFLLRALVIAATYTPLWCLVRGAGTGPRLASLLTIAAALAGSANWSFRPQLLVYPLFVLALFVLHRWVQGKQRELWVLPMLSALWVNLHGSFPLLFALAGLALIFGRGDRRRLAIAMGFAALACLANPHGVYALGYVRNMLADPSNQLSIEWGPMANRGWQANLFFAWLLAFALCTSVSARKPTPLDWAYYLVFGWLALSGMRYVIWFSFVLALQTGLQLAAWGQRVIDRPVRSERVLANILAGALFILLPFWALPGVREHWWPEAPPALDSANPVAATNWLALHPEFAGPLFSDLSHSSYLIFALPSRPVWIDPRFELYPPEQWDRYAAIMSTSPGWQNLLDQEGINLVMLSTEGQPKLIGAMRESAQWCQGYHDEEAVLFLRSVLCP